MLITQPSYYVYPDVFPCFIGKRKRINRAGKGCVFFIKGNERGEDFRTNIQPQIFVDISYCCLWIGSLKNDIIPIASFHLPDLCFAC